MKNIESEHEANTDITLQVNYKKTEIQLLDQASSEAYLYVVF